MSEQPVDHAQLVDIVAEIEHDIAIASTRRIQDIYAYCQDRLPEAPAALTLQILANVHVSFIIDLAERMAGTGTAIADIHTIAGEILSQSFATMSKDRLEAPRGEVQ